ncbi:hypothetical protein M446_7046 (plasmid) [Methylobacterium sp. 4-46]|nr:hypothetical protein [Methylobacterium sp. 4-46]ACA21264.1 hypothetical protein M446_7046 [Methylobacterium sp. 4-46]
MPEHVWTALKLKAVERKVSVTDLVIEVLTPKGYGDIDLAAVLE